MNLASHSGQSKISSSDGLAGFTVSPGMTSSLNRINARVSGSGSSVVVQSSSNSVVLAKFSLATVALELVDVLDGFAFAAIKEADADAPVDRMIRCDLTLDIFIFNFLLMFNVTFYHRQ